MYTIQVYMKKGLLEKDCKSKIKHYLITVAQINKCSFKAVTVLGDYSRWTQGMNDSHVLRFRREELGAR